LLRKLGYPLLICSWLALHCFTAVTAYKLAGPGWKGYGALVAAWAFPLVSEAIVAYYSWRASGSIVNKYSVWILIWLVVGLGIWWLTVIRNQLEAWRSSSAPDALKGASSVQPSDGSVSSRLRRQMVFYGVPAALFACGGGWTLLSRRSPQREQDTERLASASPDAPQSVPVEFPPMQNAEQPYTARPSADTKKAPVGAKPEARLGFAVSPWGEVYVDGRKKGVSPPMKEIKLAPGKYTIEIRNTRFPPRIQTVDLRAKARLRIKHKFQ
jgi:hypothetical protein